MKAQEISPGTQARAEDVAQQERGEHLSTHFAGRRWPIFKLTLGTGVLTVLTLGLYRFWQKTRIRRWYWSAIRPGGHPLDYVGEPFEKLLGFLIAVVILAFYIGIVNLGLMFASFAVFQGNTAAYALSFVGVIPIWFYARYRARRYVLARTRWMGLRFGLAPGAWGFALRALWHWLLTLITLGLLWPRMTFKLEKYRTDRTWFGDHSMEQGGSWFMLFWCIKWHLFALGLLFVSTVVLGAGLAPLAILGYILAGLMLLFGAVYYRVETRKRMAGAKRLGPIRLQLVLSPFRVFWILLSGYALALLVSAIPTAFLGVLFLRLQSADTLTEVGMENVSQLFSGADRWLLVGMTAMSYFAVFLIWSAVTQAWVTLPLTRLYARGLRIDGAESLPAIHQRPRDDHLEAEGFAEALDVGASL
ncbi:DUF898 family protein [Antarctobacter heliothermus]|uniref:DUF898 family protein n=1 Tax=Antarctobacter heliothermus TaxID=74033 RepID=UPI001FE39D2A|nr:DUF898 family protein [Antarctobacter heliothermus]